MKLWGIVLRRKQQREPDPLPPGLVIGGLVRYYKNGWRAGHLSAVEGRIAKIMPIAGKSHAVRNVNILLDDVLPIQVKEDSAITQPRSSG